MSILEHRWGESTAADRVWSDVAGLAPSLHPGCRYLFLQVYIDESVEDGPEGTFAIAGYFGEPAAWAEFSAEWEQMLPLGVLAEDGSYHFKMSEMAKLPERMDRVPGFYRLIEKYAFASVSVVFGLGDLRRAIERLVSLGRPINRKSFCSPYQYGFSKLMALLHHSKFNDIQLLPPDARLSFFFDERSEKKQIQKAWDRVVPGFQHPERFAGLRFESDRDYLPLQAADLWAWWMREWSVRGELWARMEDMDFGRWIGSEDAPPRVLIEATEDDMVNDFIRAMATQDPSARVYDARQLLTASGPPDWRGGFAR